MDLSIKCYSCGVRKAVKAFYPAACERAKDCTRRQLCCISCYENSRDVVRKCSRCHAIKPLGAFFAGLRTRYDGYQPACRDCRSRTRRRRHTAWLKEMGQRRRDPLRVMMRGNAMYRAYTLVDAAREAKRNSGLILGCSCCKKQKDAVEFPKARKVARFFSHECRECLRERMRARGRWAALRSGREAALEYIMSVPDRELVKLMKKHRMPMKPPPGFRIPEHAIRQRKRASGPLYRLSFSEVLRRKVAGTKL